MKILLAKAAHITSTQVAIIPPLGLLYIAGSIRKDRPDDLIRIIDCRIESDQEFSRIVAEWKPDVIGISAITVESGHALELAEISKAASPDSVVVMGGPHPTSYNDEVLSNPSVDYTVLHEGEITFLRLLDALERGAPVDNVNGIGLRDADGLPSSTVAREFVQDLDQIPHPAWDMVDFSRYEKVKSMSLIGARRVAPIFTSRACPYRCTYCHNMFGKKFQKRSVENVLDEMEILVHQYGVQRFEIIDDIFNIDKIRTAEILQGILDRGLDVKLSFPNGLRGDLLTEELVDLFARAGTEFVSLAIETASPRLQKYIRKHIKLDKIQDVIGWFVERKVFTNCFYMLGFPTETVAEMRQTIDFACRQPSHTAMFFIVTPFNGTELVDQVKDIDADYHLDFNRYAYHETDLNVSGNIPTNVLQRSIKVAYLRFLSNPIRLFRLVKDHPNKKFLLQMAWMLVHRIFFDNLNHRDMIVRLRTAVGLEKSIDRDGEPVLAASETRAKAA